MKNCNAIAVPDPIGEHERSLFSDGEGYKNAVIVPEMLVKLKQGFGRLIRCEIDTGGLPCWTAVCALVGRTVGVCWRRCPIAGW